MEEGVMYWAVNLFGRGFIRKMARNMSELKRKK
ncbi:hypothetical protein RB531_5170 [Salmonella enterica subsp. enterica serovar Typhimurium]